MYLWPARVSLFASHIQTVVLILKHHFALLTMGKVFTQVNETEHRLVKMMAKEGIPWTRIQRITARSADTMSNILKKRLLARFCICLVETYRKNHRPLIDRSSTAHRPLIDRYENPHRPHFLIEETEVCFHQSFNIQE